MKFNRLVVAGAALFCLAGNSFAAQLFYGGDFDGVNGLAVDFDAFTFDDFDITGPGAVVDSVYGNCLSNADFASMVMTWEIRSGISEGNGGVLEASGSGTPTVTPTGRSGFGFTEYNIRISGLAVALNAGTYFFGMNVGEDAFGGRTFVSTTSGANSVGSPIANGNSFFNSGFFGFTYSSTANVLGAEADFSYGIDGEAVPEPATLVALGVGLAALAARRRRS
ncbi:MAG: PEP-CTERM sorting domain-containing protein [Fimbriimonadales bacterium]